jgi:putative GTP pyrophosphokinase
MEKQEFLNKYDISSADFKKSKLKWEDLMLIYEDYKKNKHIFEPAAKDIVERLLKLRQVHSVRYRIKDAEHLIEKIIRKRISSPSKSYTIANYKDKITDIIGVRAMHLYKSDWEGIGEFVETTWTSKEKPTANIRKGDSDEIIANFKSKGYKIHEHKYGYRSIHYIIESNPTKTTFIAELQVRTVFEEGWSEIDHDIRYPYDIDNPILKGYLAMFNRLAGNADEMGSYIKFLQKELANIDSKHEREISKRDTVIQDLRNRISKLKIDKKSKDLINSDINKIVHGGTYRTSDIKWNNFFGGPSASIQKEPFGRKCTNCGKSFSMNDGFFITRCPYCGHSY